MPLQHANLIPPVFKLMRDDSSIRAHGDIGYGEVNQRLNVTYRSHVIFEPTLSDVAVNHGARIARYLTSCFVRGVTS